MGSEDEEDESVVRASSRPGDMIPSKLTTEDLDDRLALDELALDEYGLDSIRSRRKRRSLSADPDDDEDEGEDEVLNVRKRRRHQSTDVTGDDSARDSGSGEPTRAASRALRLKVSRPPPPVTIQKRSRTALVVQISVRPGNLKEILSRKKRDRRRTGGSSVMRPTGSRPGPGPGRPALTPALLSAMPTPFTSDSYSQPFYSFFDKETEMGKPYGGILTEAEADTSKTLPASEDRKQFEQAKKKAEDEWRTRVLAIQADADLPIRRPKKASDNASQIECVEFGGWEIDTWYAAPYPAEYSRNRVLYICEFCLKYMNSDYVAWRHKLKCGTKHPPGDEIYRHESVSIFEVDGRKHPVYCQNLCLMAKLFLGSKTLYYDVEPFLFYVLCEFNDTGYHFVGYFSKEKRASSQNNVSCILTLPIHQRKGYGNLLIDFSYLLTKVEEKTGSPEKPLSDMGLVSYRNYWRLELCKYFLEFMESGRHKEEGLSIKTISDETGMTADDVVSALEGLRALVRDPQTQLYAFRVDLNYCRGYVGKWESKSYVQLKPSALAWTPYVMGRSNMVNFELGPPISTIAPREEDEAKVQEGPNGPSSKVTTNGDQKEATSQEEAGGAESGEDDNTSSTPVKSIEKLTVEDKENEEPQDEEMGDADADVDGDGDGDGDADADSSGLPSWAAPYKDIAPSRFEVFPPLPGSKRLDRARSSISRPSAPRTGSSTSLSRPKRPSGSARRRSSAGRPRSNRKPGGTGRGPGRWPKGTKKSDYGNADSGPGLPPSWREKQQRTHTGPDGLDSSALEDTPAQEEVRVLVAGKAVNGTSRSVSGSASAAGRSRSRVTEDDVDAEGEDE